MTPDPSSPAVADPLRPLWLSWWQDLAVGFELHSPWWTSGYRFVGDDDQQASICAAVMAVDEADARQRVISAHDETSIELEFRFVEAREPGWSPFSDRFRRATWMRWNDSANPSDSQP